MRRWKDLDGIFPKPRLSLRMPLGNLSQGVCYRPRYTVHPSHTVR